MFNKYVLAIALAFALVASIEPLAFAASKSKHVHNPLWATPESRGPIVPRARHSAWPSVDVYDHRGQYVGSDPDVRVRWELPRDQSTAD